MKVEYNRIGMYERYRLNAPTRWMFKHLKQFLICVNLYYYPSTSCFLCSFFKMHNRKALIR
ncbi:hypothetical protein KsCSTR_34290 [Candidatus Kuenenia stuttgartiensis]|uniref:Uncharacterized protein n=1 Tax=Kuenenia stuttgartiensis TaxID=174633 RepID=Q1Q470_KUEST|nr:hypothetical protein KsCSTR_34290 [Candidatus Kuenenia stuttgartiensis]CAJ74814.1 unknown protein [Candidatus Kuenenia stuttgartiensis]